MKHFGSSYFFLIHCKGSAPVEDWKAWVKNCGCLHTRSPLGGKHQRPQPRQPGTCCAGYLIPPYTLNTVMLHTNKSSSIVTTTTLSNLLFRSLESNWNNLSTPLTHNSFISWGTRQRAYRVPRRHEQNTNTFRLSPSEKQ